MLVYLAVLPLVMLLWGSFQAEVAPREYAFTIENYAAAYASPYTYSTLRNSLAFAAGAALLSFALGTALAWLVERTNLPFRQAFLPLSLVPLVMPGVLEAIAWIFLLSPKIGYVNLALMSVFGLPAAPFDIFSLGGMIWVQALGQAPLAFLLMMAAFKSMDPSLEESAMASGASLWATARRITLPLLLPAVGSVLLILFVRSIEAFEVPAIIGIPARTFVYTSEIWTAFTEFPPDYGRGAALAVGLLAISGLGVCLYTRATGRSERFQTVTGKAFRPRTFDLGPWRWVAFAGLCGYFGLVLLLPFLVLLWNSLLPFVAAPSAQALGQASLANYAYLLSFEPFRRAAVNSVVLAVLAASAVMLLTAIIAWVAYKSRLPGAKLLDYLAFLPVAVPGLVLGMALIWFYVAFPLPIYGTLWVLLIAYATKYLPYGMRATSGSIVQISRELEEAAGIAGGSWWQTFRRVTLPLLRPGLVAGWIYVLIISFREFSTSVLLATSQSMVLSILVFTMFEQGQVTVVAAIAVLMIALLLAIVGIVYKVSGRVGIQA
ncbi:MAG TPA: iron ABC transporter permease [Chloroflexota bacterium]|nr:iron ABC transporter permease [Chloroflexota bacterium]